jgi:hypothetical protein
MAASTDLPASGQTRGVVYVATSGPLLQEAEHSVASLRRHNPGLPVLLVTHQPPPAPELWDAVHLLESPSFSSKDKLHMSASPWERTLFLDTDTLVFAPLDEVFELLDRFDFAAVQTSSGYHYKIESLPNTFPEFNSGVIAFRKSEKLPGFFDLWLSLYNTFSLENKDRIWDQKSLRLALYQSNLRIACLPPEYNFMPYAAGLAATALKIVHGRPMAQLLKLKSRMDRKLGMRAWVPGMGCLHDMFHLPFSILLRIYFRSAPDWLRWFLLRQTGRLPKGS